MNKTYYGLWRTDISAWSEVRGWRLGQFESPIQSYANVHCTLNSQAARSIRNRMKKTWESFGFKNVWQVKIIGDDGLPVDLPREPTVEEIQAHLDAQCRGEIQVDPEIVGGFDVPRIRN